MPFLIDYDNGSRKYGSEFINIATRRPSPIITSASFFADGTFGYTRIYCALMMIAIPLSLAFVNSCELRGDIPLVRNSFPVEHLKTLLGWGIWKLHSSEGINTKKQQKRRKPLLQRSVQAVQFTRW